MLRAPEERGWADARTIKKNQGMKTARRMSMEFIATGARPTKASAADRGSALHGGDEGEAGPGTMHVYAGLIQAGTESEREQLILLKGRAHRDRAVIERDLV